MRNTRTATVQNKLKRLSTQLQQIGRADLAEDVQSILDVLHPVAASAEPREVLTTGEAARILGVRSITTIKRWAAEGLIDGFRRGRRIVVSRESVERMLNTPTVAEQRRREKQIADDLAAFGGDEEDIPEPEPWSGRKPWEPNAEADA